MYLYGHCIGRSSGCCLLVFLLLFSLTVPCIGVFSNIEEYSVHILHSIRRSTEGSRGLGVHEGIHQKEAEKSIRHMIPRQKRGVGIVVTKLGIPMQAAIFTWMGQEKDTVNTWGPD